MDAAASDDLVTVSNVDVDGDTVTWDQVLVDAAGETLCFKGMTTVVRDSKTASETWPVDHDFGCP